MFSKNNKTLRILRRAVIIFIPTILLVLVIFKDDIFGKKAFSASNYFGDESDGAAHFTTNTSFSNTADGDYVVKEYSSLIIDSGVTVTTANRAKGLFIYVKGDATINGTLSMTARGANADPVASGVSATGLRLPMYKSGSTETLAAADFAGAGTDVQSAVSNQLGISGNGKIYTIKRTGGAGAQGGAGDSDPGNPGGTTTEGTGGGAGGGNGQNALHADNGWGAAGTCFSGGGGSGGYGRGGIFNCSISATANGGVGGCGAGKSGSDFSEQQAGGGAGNPGGSGGGGGVNGEDGTGGVLWLVVGGDLTIGATGSLEAEGMDGGRTTDQGGGGGASGGGIVYALYAGSLSNSGSISVAGGTGGYSNYGDGGNGGAGYYLLEQVAEGNTAPSSPTSLEAEGQTNPVNVTDTTPEFTAIYDDPDTTDTATLAEVQVGTTAGANDMWDSGSIDIADISENTRSGEISYAGSSLSWGTQYFWRIRFYDGDTWGAWSANANFTTQSTPTAPSGATANYSATNSSYVTWTDNSTYEDQFRVEYSINDGAWTFHEDAVADATQSSTLAVGADNKVAWRVRAENTAGESAYATSGTAYMTPTDPTSVSISWTVQDETIEVSWTDNSTYEDNFEIQNSINDGTWSANIATPAASPYDDTSPTGSDKKYEYRVRAATPAGDDTAQYSAWVESGAIYSTITYPSPPTSLQTEDQTNPTDIQDTTPEFSAVYNDDNAADLANKYEIQVDDNSDFSSVYWDSGPSGTAMTDCVEGTRCEQLSYGGSDLTRGTTYYWRIRYWDSNGDEGAWSNETATFSVIIKRFKFDGLKMDGIILQ